MDARHRYLRVTVTNGDDAPLEALRVTPLAGPRPLLLAAGHRPPFAVYYGAEDVAAPAYDFARLPAAATGFERAGVGTLGAEAVNDLFEPPADTRTFFERNRGAVNGAAGAGRDRRRSRRPAGASPASLSRSAGR